MVSDKRRRTRKDEANDEWQLLTEIATTQQTVELTKLFCDKIWDGKGEKGIIKDGMTDACFSLNRYPYENENLAVDAYMTVSPSLKQGEEQEGRR